MMNRCNKVTTFLIGMGVLLTATAALAQAPTMDWISMKSPIPVPVSWGASTAYDGKVYIIGGIRYDDPSPDAGDCPLLQIYDIATDTWTMGAPRTYSLRLSSAAALNGKIYVTGGRDVSAAYDYNEIYDIATNTWSAGQRMPSVLRGHTAVAVDGKIYTFGGNRGIASSIYSNAVNIYDPATNTWTAGQVSPVRWAYGGAAYCASTGKVYLVAGDDGSCWDCTGQFPQRSYGYHVATNTWDSTFASMPDPPDYPGIHLFGIASTDDKVYTFGGGYYDGSYDQAPFPFVFVLDATTNTWDYGPTLPDPIERFTTMCGTDGGKIYIAGGRQVAIASSVLKGNGYIEEFDPAMNTYFAPFPESPDVRFGAAVQGANGKVYAIGGAFDQAYGSVIVFDPVANAWTTTNAVDPTARYMSASGVWNNKIVISGGQSDSTGSPDFFPILVGGNTTLYDPATDTFTPLAADPTPRTEAFGAVVGDVFYVFGGTDATGTMLASASALNLSTNTWSALPPLPVALTNATALATGGKVYIIGGYDGGASSDDGLHAPVFIYDPATHGYTMGAETPYPTHYASGAVYNGFLIVDGGMHRYYDAEQATVYSELAFDQQVYNPTTNTWTLMNRIWGKYLHGTAVLGNNLYSIMGQDWGYLCTRTDVAQLGSGPAPCTVTCTASASPTSGDAPLAVNFTATATATNCTGQPAYAWAFGDGATANTQNPSHTYAAAGTYTWTLTVTVDGQVCTRTGSIKVVKVASWDLSFFDDYGRAALCVNSASGQFLYIVLRGFGVGSYSGAGTVTRVNGILYLTTPLGAPTQINLRYLERYRKASASFMDRPRRISSFLMDSNTANNPAFCP